MPGTVSHHSYSLQHCQSAPKVVMKDLKKEKAEEWKAQLEAIGAKIEIE
jgi:ribosomal protein L7/L12